MQSNRMVGSQLIEDELGMWQGKSRQNRVLIILLHVVQSILQDYTTTHYSKTRAIPVMFRLTPQEDLIILAIKHNNPNHSWDQIATALAVDYHIIIPPEVCQDRYESFLSKVKMPLSPAQLLPYKMKNYQTTPAHPDSFIFAYHEQVQLSKDQDIKSRNYESVKRFEGQILNRVLFRKTKRIHKEVKQPLKSERKQMRQFQQFLYSQVKNRSQEGNLLNQEVIEQKLEQLLFEVVEKVNERLLAEGIEMIEGSMALIRLFRGYSLTLDRRQMLSMLMLEGKWPLEKCLEVKRRMEYIRDLYSYRDIVAEGQEVKQEVEATQDKIETKDQKDTQQAKVQFFSNTTIFPPSHNTPQMFLQFIEKTYEPASTVLSPLPLIQTETSPRIQETPLQQQLAPEIVEQPERMQQQIKTKVLSLGSMQITVAKGECMGGNEEEQQVKVEPKMEYEVKEEEVAGKKIKRWVRRKKRVLPSSGKTWIILDD